MDMLLLNITYTLTVNADGDNHPLLYKFTHSLLNETNQYYYYYFHVSPFILLQNQ